MDLVAKTEPAIESLGHHLARHRATQFALAVKYKCLEEWTITLKLLPVDCSILLMFRVDSNDVACTSVKV